MHTCKENRGWMKVDSSRRRHPQKTQKRLRREGLAAYVTHGRSGEKATPDFEAVPEKKLQ